MICHKEKCTGCFACVNICPKNCISMQENEFGEIYPEIDEEKCVHCNMCKKTCPVLNKVDRKNPTKAYASFSINIDNQKTSNSGGIAALLYKFTIDNNGVVYGVPNINKDKKFEFARIDKENELYKLKKSKYVHSYINNTFKLIRNDLLDKKNVLFIGTPCQVAGLKNFLKIDYENLLTCDLICHGVVSQKIMFEDIQLHKINIDDIKNIDFRKDNNYCFVIKNNKNQIIEISQCDDYFLTLFLSGEILRKNCVTCDYANNKRVGDITIGDFWGLKSQNKLLLDNYKNGMSCVLINSKKGQKYFDKIKAELNYEERDVEEAINGNTQLRHPINNIEGNNIFRKNYKNIGYKKACKKILGVKFEIKRMKIYKIYRKVKNGRIQNKK